MEVRKVRVARTILVCAAAVVALVAVGNFGVIGRPGGKTPVRQDGTTVEGGRQQSASVQVNDAVRPQREEEEEPDRRTLTMHEFRATLEQDLPTLHKRFGDFVADPDPSFIVRIGSPPSPNTILRQHFPKANVVHDEVYLAHGLRRPYWSGQTVRIGYNLHIFSNEALGEETAAAYTFGQRALPPKAAVPEGTFTGLPLGAKCWYSAAGLEKGTPPSRQMICGLVFYDGPVAITTSVQYPAHDPMAGTITTDEITDGDLLMTEYVGRLVLSTALKLHYSLSTAKRGTSEVAGVSFPTRTLKHGVTLVPLRPYASAVGALIEDGAPDPRVTYAWVPARGVYSGCWTLRLGGRPVVAALAARELLVRDGSVPLSAPILEDGGEVWVNLGGLRKALELGIER